MAASASAYSKTQFYQSGKILATPPPGEEVVISGLAGVFPDSRDVHHFRDNLFNKIDMVSGDSRRWEPTHPEIPQRTGKLWDIQKFDAGFFGIHYRQAEAMDPICRILLERAVEAVFDAGMHPSELEGTSTGVFVGACFSESEKSWFFDNLKTQHFGITGNERSMIAQRVSYFLKLKGPTFITDTACSSSLYALEHAYKAIRNGSCDTAIVGGSNVVLHPFVSLQFARLGVLSPDGRCKAFDKDGDGYARSESVAVIILQKAKDARRIYSTVLHAKTNCDGYKPQSITYPSGEAQKNLLETFYEECDVDPTSLSFLEAHGTGTAVGDPEELLAIDEVFCKNRKTPLLVGSVKSSIGHTEPSSGLCSITKAILGLERGIIPPNLHFKNPREGVECLDKGRLKVVTENTPFEDDRGLIGVNSFGFGGGNAHILLKWNEKLKNNQGIPRDGLARIICASARVSESLNKIFDDLSSRALDCEHVRLYHQIFIKDISSHVCRGFTIISNNSGELKRSMVHFGTKKDLYLAFTSFGNSWCYIPKHFFGLPLFAATIQRIHAILAPKGVNITEIVLKNNAQPSEFSVRDNIIGTAAVQIALVDILKTLEIQVCGYFGFGFGEFICAYFENCLTLEETVLPICFLANNFDKIQSNLDIIALTLNTLMPNPRPRSKLWLSPIKSKLASADHFLSSVFTPYHLEKSQITNHRHSVILQLGSEDLHHVNQLKFDNPQTTNSFENFLELLGHLYESGHNFPLHRLYPDVEFPVSRGTPMISPHIKWEHRSDWFVTFYEHRGVLKSGERSISLSSKDDEWLFIGGHVVDGRNLFPATGYLILAWIALSKVIGVMFTDMKIIFENCKFLRATNVPKDAKVELTVMVQRKSGNFEVIESGTAIVTGNVKTFDGGRDEQIELPIPTGVRPEIAQPLLSRDIYKELRLRGYNYKSSFRLIQKCDSSATSGLIHWDDTWITFIDNMLQMKILQLDTRSLYVPTGIRRLTIDAKAHLAYVYASGEDMNLPVHVYKDCDVIRSGAIEMRGISANSIVRRRPLGQPVIEKYLFVPNCAELSLQDSVRVIVQTILENLPTIKVKAVELLDGEGDQEFELLAPMIHEVLADLPLIQPIITVLSKREMKIQHVVVEDKKLVVETDCTMVVGTNLLQRALVLKQAFGATKDNAFVISREPPDFHPKASNLSSIDILLTHTTPLEKLYLLRKRIESKPPTVVDIPDDDTLTWLPTLQKSIRHDPNVIILSQNLPLSGVLGLVNCIRREPGCGHVKAVLTFDGAPEFDLEAPFYAEQIQKQLAINVCKNSSWGTYRHLMLESSARVTREHCFVNVTTRGDLSSLRWFEGHLSRASELPAEKQLTYVYYSALNFRDIMTASGRINVDVVVKDRTEQDFVHGFEFAGKTPEGRKIMGIATGSLSTLVAADKYLSWPIPELWSLEEAATIPVVYTTVLFALFIECSIKGGQSILIHAGSGGIGLAAIGLSLHRGLNVFTTVGTSEKREFLKKQFPQLTDENIGNSRDVSFEQMIQTRTDGEGVDYVLNSLSEEKLLASVRVLKAGGHFIEIGKFDLAINNNLRLKLLEKDCCFHGVMVDAVFNCDPSFKKTIRELMIDGISCGSIKPLVRTVFKMDDIEQAFRFMASGKHMGKVLIQVRRELDEQVPQKEFFNAVPRFYCDANKVQIIVGGLGGFGLELADWLIIRGARKLILTSRKGISTGYQQFRINTWLNYGTSVKVSVADVTTRSGCQELLKEALTIGEIESIFNLAVVLKDGIFENQTQENFSESLKPKAFATKYLDEASRVYCKSLRNFIIFSSVSCGRGNAGQTNYGMANSIMERICERRKFDNLPALAIQWGAVGDVGLVADMQEEHTELEIGGTLQQKISNCLEVLDVLINQDNAIVSSMVVAEKRGGAGGADNLVDAVANILGLKDLKTISLHATLSELGMDSMTAVEIKQTLEREYEVFLTPTDIRSMTFAKLLEIQEERELEDEDAKKDRAVGGFEMMIRHMNDEQTAEIPLLMLESVDQDNCDAPLVVMLPGIEGVAKVLQPLASNLRARVKCLQFLYETPQETMHDMALGLVHEVEQLLSKSQAFCIVAYSYGTMVGLELVSMLEQKGYFGTYVCLDGGPDNLRELLKNSLNLNSDALFQTGFIMQLMSLHTPIEILLKNRERFLTCKSFEDRLNLGEEILPKGGQHSASYLRAFATALYKRLKMLGIYEPKFAKIKSKVKLFKPCNVSITGVADDYKLSELCEEAVEVRSFKGNHVTFLENSEMADAINDIIGRRIGAVEGKKEKILIGEEVIMSGRGLIKQI